MNSWQPAFMPDQTHKIILITGGTSGIGKAAATALYRRNATVLIAGRNRARGQAAANQIHHAAPYARGSVHFLPLDVTNLTAITTFAQRLATKVPHLDGLINDAGLLPTTPIQLMASGFDLQLATSFIGPFALTGCLLPLLRASRAARVVTVSSLAARVGQLQLSRWPAPARRNAWLAYADAKRANLSFGQELQAQATRKHWPLTSIIVQPGAARTAQQRLAGSHGLLGKMLQLSNPLLPAPAQAASTLLFAMTAEHIMPGDLYGPGGFLHIWGAPAKADATTDSAQDHQLWHAATTWTHINY